MMGFGVNLKLVLCLKVQSLTERLGFLNPPHRQAAKTTFHAVALLQAAGRYASP